MLHVLLLLAASAVFHASDARSETGNPASATPAVAAPNVPPGDSVIARFVAAVGGRAAHERLPGWCALGRFEVPSQGLEGTIRVYAAPPNLRLMKIEIPGIGTVRSGFDGRVGWSIHPATGAQLLRGRMLDQYRQEAEFLSLLRGDESIDSVETLGIESFEGRPCHRVRVTTRAAESYTEYFDVETGLLTGTRRKIATPSGDIPSVTIIGDYRPVRAALMPMKLTQRMLGMEQIMIVDSVMVSGVDATVFELPKEIQVLARKSAEVK
jgi:hypothetical protein